MKKLINYFHYSVYRLNLHFHVALYYATKPIGILIMKNDKERIMEHERYRLSVIKSTDFIIGNRFTTLVFVGMFFLIFAIGFNALEHLLHLGLNPFWVYYPLSVVLAIIVAYYSSYRNKCYQAFFEEIEESSKIKTYFIHFFSALFMVALIFVFVLQIYSN